MKDTRSGRINDSEKATCCRKNGPNRDEGFSAPVTRRLAPTNSHASNPPRRRSPSSLYYTRAIRDDNPNLDARFFQRKSSSPRQARVTTHRNIYCEFALRHSVQTT